MLLVKSADRAVIAEIKFRSGPQKKIGETTGS